METPFNRRCFALLLGALALGACTEAVAPAPGGPAPAERRAYRFDGVAGASDVTFEKAADGRERLRGSTEVATRPGETGRTVARETASLDERGRLTEAEIVVVEAGAAIRYTLQPSRGAVRVARPGAPPVDWRVPDDAPWLYAPGPDDEAFITTPVAAWIALRAARSADVVRVLEPERQRSYLMTVDQVAVPTELGTTVALGADGVDIDEHFVSELRLRQSTVTLARVGEAGVVPRT